MMPRHVSLLLVLGLLVSGCAEQEAKPAMSLGRPMASLPRPMPPSPPGGLVPDAPPAEIVTEGLDEPEGEIALSPGVTASLEGLRRLDTAGRGAMQQAEARQAEAGEVDRCALEAVLAVGARSGPADGARFAVWLADRARGRGDGEAMPALVDIAIEIARGLQPEAEAARLLEFDDPQRLAESASLARGATQRCPPDAAKRLSDHLAAAQAA